MINILLCDDNSEITDELSNLISTFSEKNNIYFNIDKRSSGDFILNNTAHYDIAIIDIEMPGISGIRLAEKLKENNDDVLVMVLTSFQNYLDSAMKIHVFRYLSKPIEKNRFYLNFKEAIDEYTSISKQITITSNDNVHLIKTKDILYIETSRYGATIYTKKGDFETRKKPKVWRAEINQNNCFVFSHNSILVNLQNVINFNKSEVVLRKDENTTVTTYMSQRKYSDFKKSFFNFAGGIK